MKHQLTAGDALARLPGPKGERHVGLFTHETLDVELHAPREHDPQEPHTKDEVYVVVEGTGRFRTARSGLRAHGEREPGHPQYIRECSHG